MVAGNGTVARGIETRYLGAVLDEEILADAYRAADVFAVPTLADVLTQTAPESIACGTPCVSFDRGGVIDVVRHLETGYQARFGDVDDLARGLTTLLGDSELLARLVAPLPRGGGDGVRRPAAGGALRRALRGARRWPARSLASSSRRTSRGGSSSEALELGARAGVRAARGASSWTAARPTGASR